MITLFEAFAGYGSQSLSLRNIEVDYQTVGISEIDKYAIQAYRTLHGDIKNYGDISLIDWNTVPDFDLFTYSFPCTDISVAGQMKGIDQGSGTRSSLLWECKKAIEIKKPKYLLMENVKNLLSKKFISHFLEWELWLTRQGYTNFTEVLNAKNFGVPQNRERVFMVSVLGDAWYNFPQPQRVITCIADILEDEVDSKYYLSDTMLKGFIKHAERHNERGNGFAFKPNDLRKVAKCVSTCEGARSTGNFIKVVGNLDTKHEERSRTYSTDGISPTIQTCQGGGRQPKVLLKENIRRLTPKECFRLMGVPDTDFKKLNEISDTQLYKLAGNSIVVPVLEGIFRNLFIDN